MLSPRRTRIAAALLAGVALVPTSFAAAASAQSEAPSAVTIDWTPADSDLPCSPGALGLTRSVHNDPESFALTVTAAAAPCAPIEAKAVVYAMPHGGGQWPQTLVEVVPFTIAEAGVMEITFEKGCDPVQFDVLTGETPAQIAPTGPWHGPLLFPLDIETSHQHFGSPECNPTTTTSTTSSTTSTAPEVLASTTIPVSSSTAPAQVAAETTVPVDNAAVESPADAPARLAMTGSSSRTGFLLGVASLLAGSALLLLARRRSALRP